MAGARHMVQIKLVSGGSLASNFGANIKLNYKYDPSLIGGLIIKVESTMIDTSIKSKLKQLETKMIEA